jgi:DMSO reductase anchor subunit
VQPLTNTLVLVDHNNIAIHAVHLGPNPRCRNALKRKGHDMLSKALASSTLRSNEGILF